MKKFSIKLGILSLILFPSMVIAQNIIGFNNQTVQLWNFISNTIVAGSNAWGLKVPKLGSSGNPCVTVGSTGIFATSTCGSGGGTPSGTSTAVQFNNNGSFGGNTDFLWANQHALIGTSSAAFTSATSTGPYGSLAASTTYYYKVVARTIDGTTLPSAQVSALTTGTFKAINLRWSIFSGATSYDIYRSTTSGVFGATSFLINIDPETAYTLPDSQPPEDNSYQDNGTVALTSGTPPTVNTAYVNKIGTLNHLGGSIVYPMNYSVVGPGSTTVDTFLDSTGITVPLRAAFFISPQTELNDQGDIPIFCVGRDTLGFSTGLPYCLNWQEGDLGGNTFAFQDTLGNPVGLKVATLQASSINLSNTMVANAYQALNAGSNTSVAYGIGFTSGFYDNSATQANSWAWAINSNVAWRFGQDVFSLTGDANNVGGNLGTNKLSRFNVYSSQDAFKTGTASSDGAGNMTGVGTKFTTEFAVGDSIAVGASGWGVITAINSDTALTTSPSLSNTFSGPPYKRQSIVTFGSPVVPSTLVMDGNGYFGFDGPINPAINYQMYGTMNVTSNAAFGSINTSGAVTLGVGSSIVGNTSTGFKLLTATNQKLGIWNAAPIVQPANTVAQDAVLTTTGLQASGGTPWFTSILGVGTSTPAASLAVSGTSTSPTLPVFLVASSTNAVLFKVAANGSTTITNLAASAPVYTDANSALTTAPPSGYLGSALVATSTHLLGLTAAKSINSFTSGSATSSIEVTGYVKIKSVTTDVAQFQISYIDEGGTAQTYTGASLSTTGTTNFSAGEIRMAPNTTASTSVQLTTSIGSISYDAGVSIKLLSNK